VALSWVDAAKAQAPAAVIIAATQREIKSATSLCLSFIGWLTDPLSGAPPA